MEQTRNDVCRKCKWPGSCEHEEIPNLGYELAVSQPWNPREFTLSVRRCDLMPPYTRVTEAASGGSWDREKPWGWRVTMSFGAISLDDDYDSSLASPDGAEVGGEPAEDMLRICVVGSGTRFISGISYYTYYLSGALAETFDVSVVLMRRLLPRRFYPGRKRVERTSPISRHPALCRPLTGWTGLPCPAFSGLVDFCNGSSQMWSSSSGWTGTVLHSFLYLLWVARRAGGVRGPGVPRGSGFRGGQGAAGRTNSSAGVAAPHTGS